MSVYVVNMKTNAHGYILNGPVSVPRLVTNKEAETQFGPSFTNTGRAVATSGLDRVRLTGESLPWDSLPSRRGQDAKADQLFYSLCLVHSNRWRRDSVKVKALVVGPENTGLKSFQGDSYPEVLALSWLRAGRRSVFGIRFCLISLSISLLVKHNVNFFFTDLFIWGGVQRERESPKQTLG